ncbi:cytosolic endo-beta-N-acetylglucosaminidase-like [Liolophura sinensis]|uniref:cytosolic endo-beta-N-acetylglucosaminidase-like n=1 Tax=Liolophura sinensis TaxID=3198878 RepID=UPI003158D960
MAEKQHRSQFAQCWDESGDPVIQPLDTLEALLEWEPGRDAACVSITLLRGAPKRRSAPSTLICHDLSGGYLEDRFVQGVVSPDEECYRFYHWWQVDTFIYFSHRFITIPPSGWLTAAHKHGVKVLGTFITEWEDGAEKMATLLSSEQTITTAVEKMTAIAQYYNFDGWLINIENKIETSKIDLLVKFVEKLTESTRSSLPHGTVIWYDSVTSTGELEWQNALNDRNSLYFDICDGIFLNYTWTDDNLAQSKAFAEARGRPWDVWVGVDVFGRGCRGGGGFNTTEAVEAARARDLSLALFAQGWTYQCLPKEDFTANNNKFWKMLEDCCHTRCLTDLPVCSHFCQGFGKAYFLNGQKMSAKPWFNLGLQSLQLPEGCEEFKGDNLAHKQANVVVASLCTENAFRGGSCLRLDCHMTDARCSKCYNLFQTNIELAESIIVSLSWKSETTDCEVFLEMSMRKGNVQQTFNLVPLSQSREKPTTMESDVVLCHPLSSEQLQVILPVLGKCQPEKDGWKTSYFLFNKPDAKTVIESVGVGIQSIEGGHVAALLGMLQILPLSSCQEDFPAVKQLTFTPCPEVTGGSAKGKSCVKKAWLSWAVTDPRGVDYFNVFGSDQKLCMSDCATALHDWTLLGHSVSCSFCVKSTSGSGFVLHDQIIQSLLVQPVVKTGFLPSLSKCSVIQLPNSVSS